MGVIKGGVAKKGSSRNHVVIVKFYISTVSIPISQL